MLGLSAARETFFPRQRYNFLPFFFFFLSHPTSFRPTINVLMKWGKGSTRAQEPDQRQYCEFCIWTLSDQQQDFGSDFLWDRTAKTLTVCTHRRFVYMFDSFSGNGDWRHVQRLRFFQGLKWWSVLPLNKFLFKLKWVIFYLCCVTRLVSAHPAALHCEQLATNHWLILCLTRVIKFLNLHLLLIQRWQMPGTWEHVMRCRWKGCWKLKSTSGCSQSTPRPNVEFFWGNTSHWYYVDLHAFPGVCLPSSITARSAVYSSELCFGAFKVQDFCKIQSITVKMLNSYVLKSTPKHFRILCCSLLGLIWPCWLMLESWKYWLYDFS